MKVIDEQSFKEIDITAEDEKTISMDKEVVEGKFIDPEDLKWHNELFDIEMSLKNPAKIQREMAAKVKYFLDKQMKEEIIYDGKLSNYTRIWMNDFNHMLDRMQYHSKSDRDRSIESDGITHSQISKKLRQLKLLNKQ